MSKKKIDIYDDIIPFSARAIVVVEEGQVELLIQGYKFSFTIHEYSNKVVEVFLDDNILKARRILEPFGVSFQKKTKNEIYGDKFIDYVHRIYEYSNTRNNGQTSSWYLEDESTEIIEYKEF